MSFFCSHRQSDRLMNGMTDGKVNRERKETEYWKSLICVCMYLHVCVYVCVRVRVCMRCVCKSVFVFVRVWSEARITYGKKASASEFLIVIMLSTFKWLKLLLFTFSLFRHSCSSSQAIWKVKFCCSDEFKKPANCFLHYKLFLNSCWFSS